jgi:NADPH:quinone reductase-like Zn-dependent oxidoreductase
LAFRGPPVVRASVHQALRPAGIFSAGQLQGEAVVSVTAAALKPSDRLMANGVHYAPTRFPQIVGLDGVGRLSDGTWVAFFAPQPPCGGMAEQALVRRGVWLPVPDGIDDVIAALARPELRAANSPQRIRSGG